VSEFAEFEQNTYLLHGTDDGWYEYSQQEWVDEAEIRRFAEGIYGGQAPTAIVRIDRTVLT
jgi:hypothetical protein